MQLKNDASMETFATKSITKIDKYKKKRNSTSSTEHKTEKNIAKINKYKKTKQHFYDGTQNRVCNKICGN